MESKQKFMSRTMVVLFGAFICCLLWGSAFPCIKIGYRMMDITSSDWTTQILYAGCRFTLAGILVIIIGSIGKHKVLVPRKSSVKKILILCMFQTVGQYVFFYIGLAHTSGVKSSIIVGTNAFMAILIASLIFHQEKMSVPKVVGCLLGFAGVLLVTMNGGSVDLHMQFNGEGFVILSTIASAFSSALFKMYAKDEDSFLLSGYQFCAGGIIMMIAGALLGGHLNGFETADVVLLIYLALISAVAYTLWGILLKYNPVSKVAVFGFMNPIIGVILSAIFLGEGGQAAGIKSIFALILVCIGIYIVNGRFSNVEK